jgi:hypothetical protein
VTFNDAMMRAEHWMIADKKTDNRYAKDLIGGFIKEVAGNKHTRFHPKGRPDFTVEAFVFLSISANMTYQDLQIIPSVDDKAVMDKLVILYTHRKELPMPSVSPEEKKLLREEIQKQLPAYCWKLDHMEVPENLAASRFGMRPYCNPVILELLEKDVKGNQLMDIINGSDWLWGKEKHYWQGRAQTLIDALNRGLQNIRWLVRNPVEMGRMLSTLEDRGHPQVSTVKVHNNMTEYRITNPKEL